MTKIATPKRVVTSVEWITTPNADEFDKHIIGITVVKKTTVVPLTKAGSLQYREATSTKDEPFYVKVDEVSGLVAALTKELAWYAQPQIIRDIEQGRVQGPPS